MSLDRGLVLDLLNSFDLTADHLAQLVRAQHCESDTVNPTAVSSTLRARLLSDPHCCELNTVSQTAAGTEAFLPKMLYYLPPTDIMAKYARTTTQQYSISFFPSLTVGAPLQGSI